MPQEQFNPEKENIRNPEFFVSQINAISSQLERLYTDIKDITKGGNVRDGSFLRIIFDALFKGGGKLKLSAPNRKEAEEAIASHTALAEKFTDLGIRSEFSVLEEDNGQVFVVVKVQIDGQVVKLDDLFS